MADENNEVRKVNWTELFSFTHIFKGFKMAIHPSKLALALAAIVLVFLIGSVLDTVWSWGGATAQPGDVYAYYQATSDGAYAAALRTRKEGAQQELAKWYSTARADAWAFAPVRAMYAGKGPEFGKGLDAAIKKQQGDTTPPKVIPMAEAQEDARKDVAAAWKVYRKAMTEMLADSRAVLKAAVSAAEKDIENNINKKEDQDKARGQLEKDKIAFRRAIWAVRRDLIDQREIDLFGRGLSSVMMHFEGECFANAIKAVCRGNLFSGFERVLADRGVPQMAAPPAGRAGLLAGRSVPGYDAATDNPQGVGFFAWTFLMVWGPIWMLSNHLIHGFTYLVAVLAVWALFGGAVARMAALHAARAEKISWSQALRFSISKFFSFFTAPLIPLALILFMGFLLGVGGLLTLIPVINIIMGALFALGLIAAFAVAFLTVGLVAGFPLMYPTIAVEGSDSFDAISRSFGYVLTRPWRYGLYTAVAVVYGAICYLVVRLFAFLTLLSAHFFVGHGFFGKGLSWVSEPQLGEGATKVDLLWAQPTFDNLAGGLNWAALGGTETLTAALIHLWVLLVAGVVGAFALTYWVSASTTIYYLLRRKVDATDLDDVYVEEIEEPVPSADASGETKPAEPPAAASPASPAEPAPPADGPKP